MPIGNANTDSRDRRLIIVANRPQLIKQAAYALAIEALEKLAPVAWGYYGGLASVASNAYKYWKRRSLNELSDLEVLQTLESDLDLGVPLVLYTPPEAIRLFKFEVGHTPKDGSVYVQHPVMPDTYIAPEEFSRTLGKEKEAAFLQLASALGAKELRLVNAKVHSKKGLFRAKVSVPEAAAEVGVKGVEYDKEGSFIRKVYSEFGKPRSAPHVPDDLQPWVDMDPDLRTMKRDRIEGHLIKNHITLEFKERMGIGGEVAAKVAGRGLTAGGKYEAIQHSVWHFEAEYWPLDDQ